MYDDFTDEEYKEQLDEVPALTKLIEKYQPGWPVADIYFMKEFILWGLSEYEKLNKDRFDSGYQFKDLYGSYISKL